MSRSRCKRKIESYLISTPVTKDTSVLEIVNEFENSPIMSKGSRHKNTGYKIEGNESENESEIEVPDLEDNTKDSKMLK